MNDPYQTLGISRSATEKELQAAYRKLAKQHHPDLNPGNKQAEEKFKEVTAAYELLSDPDKRKRYDRGEINAAGEAQYSGFGYRDFAEGPQGGKYTSFHGFGQEAEMGDMGDIFSRFFGAQGRGRANADIKGQDLDYNLDVSFLEAALGATKRISLPNGETLDIRIPAGLHSGQKLRLKGKGATSVPGGRRGDAYVECVVAPHPYFTRKENNVYMTLPVTLTEALLGGKVMVPTISGPVAMSIPAGSNTGDMLRLKGKGIIDAGGKYHGDHYVTLSVYLPDTPDAELKEFAEKWARQHSYNPRKHMEG